MKKWIHKIKLQSELRPYVSMAFHEEALANSSRDNLTVQIASGSRVYGLPGIATIDPQEVTDSWVEEYDDELTEASEQARE